ncbi:hypothetical protein 2 [Hubei sobemo-like virus 42]|uniref:hypothetical protein 2 n=1 Tax=Hubei sobemo-like virus 42 TaxID=1923230 RepID=UPI00090B50B3|nr:hypothetical protein 2 [Hubei sobemo-like virus 42]APG75784.1 hypothetical protein 2 [Hubei sobemo-like virus 42]
MDRILYVMEQLYESVRVDHYNWFCYDNFLKVVRCLEFSSSPGYGFSRTAPTIGGWLKFDGMNFDPQRLSELWHMVNVCYREPKLFSYWKVFIKREPHKTSKMENKRWRLIQCCPLDVQVLWHMLFAKSNELEANESMSIPSVQGMVLPFGGWKEHYNRWMKNKLFFGSDKTAWDWTASEWMIELDLELRRRLIHTDDDWITQAAKVYENAFYDAHLILGDGRIYRQMYPGIIKSGCVNTISINSRCQVMLHLLYSFRKGISPYPMVVAVGDDTLQAEEHAVDKQMYERFGVVIKSVSETLEFLGREWNDDGPRPMYVSKHIFSLCYKNIELTPQILDALMREYVNEDSMFNFLTILTRELGFSSNVHSRDYYKYWMDNPDAQYLH